MVIRNLRRFTEAQHAHEYPTCSRLMADFERREVLYLAGLFHDIAKGRGGNHSQLGSRDAQRFCREHGLSPEDCELVAWLVREHLTMSSTAQKQDLTDPAVVTEFARKVGTQRRLAALYLLTVADIRGTSPKVWNAWKAKLLEDLYHGARAALAGEAPTRTIMDSIEARREDARRLLRLYAVPDGAEGRAVAPPRHAVLPAPHVRGNRVARAPPVLARRGHAPRWSRRASRAMARACRCSSTCPTRRISSRGSAASSAGRADHSRGAHPYDARRLRARHLCRARSDQSERVVSRHDPATSNSNCRALLGEQAPLAPPVDGRISRQLKHFPLTPEVQIFPDDKGTHYILEVVAGDRPGPAREDRLYAGARQRQCRQRQDQHAGRARRGRLPDRRRAPARRAGAACVWRPRSSRTCASSRTAGDRLVGVDADHVRKQDVGEAELAHVGNAHRVQDAVQVVAFVLDDARMEVRAFARELAPLRIEARDSAGVSSAAPRRESRAPTGSLPSPPRFRRTARVSTGLTSSVYGTGSASG